MEKMNRKQLPEVSAEQLVSEFDYGTISENNITKFDLDVIHYYLEWLMNTQEYQIATKAKQKPKFKVGDTVWFAYTYGETLDPTKSRYGEAVLSVVIEVEYVSTRNAYLYTIARETKYMEKFVVITCGESYLFNLDEEDKCNEFIQTQLI